MGTELEHCGINPIIGSSGSNSMEIRVNNMESIKETMQMHEDMFKHQVRELHRVYSVQKALMEELKKGIKSNRLWATPMVTSSHINQSQLINHHQHSTTPLQITCGYNPNLEADPSLRERTSSCSGDHIHAMKLAKGFDLERPAGENSDEDSEVELTLSIGGASKKKKSKGGEISNRGSFKSESGDDFIGPNTPPLLSFPWLKHKQDLHLPLNNI
ncbi:hypothetical protein Gotri_012045 [Gossypium trilobum]|uniref:Uncharacterized protein n=3 Tax=Gossypium TaxID=3633 RepID=A0A7J9DNX6_9ROSI|nr:hypothetical protein [Gossypium trilobum]